MSQLYTEAEQRAILDVVRHALAVSTNEIMVWVSISPHTRGISAYGHLDGWQAGRNKPSDFNLNVYLADDEAEALTQLAVMVSDLLEAVGVKP
jgi:hypothetical protein